MDLNAYIKPLIKWWRLVAVTTALALFSSTLSSFFLPAQFASRTTLMVGNSFGSTNPDSGQLYVANQLAPLYADMAKREPVQAATMFALGISWLPPYQTRVVPNTNIIEITVTDTSPQRAQIIANELARQLIAQTPGENGSETAIRQEFLKQQLTGLESQILETQAQLDELQLSLSTINSSSQRAETEGKITQLTLKMTNLRENYATLLYNSQQNAINNVSVIEPANLPTETVGTNKLLIIALAAAVGLVLSGAAAYFLEFLDRTIKTTADVERVFNYPVIGYLSQISENGNNAMYVLDHPNTVVAEGFRLLQSNIEFFQAYNSARTILVTSPMQGNGKTTIAVNLALSIAMSEQKVVLVDADMRRPAIHQALKMSLGPGLADVIHTRGAAKDAMRPVKGKKIEVITAGTTPPNISEVVGSRRIASVLSDLKESHDTIIVDAPPLVISDSYSLAAKVDGVILVLEPGQTKEDQAATIKDQLTRAGARVIGVVFNRITTASAKHYGDTQYLSMYTPQHFSDYITKSPMQVDDEAQKPAPAGSSTKTMLDFFEHGRLPQNVSSSLEGAFDKFDKQRSELMKRFKRNNGNGKEKMTEAEAKEE